MFFLLRCVLWQIRWIIPSCYKKSFQKNIIKLHSWYREIFSPAIPLKPQKTILRWRWSSLQHRTHNICIQFHESMIKKYAIKNGIGIAQSMPTPGSHFNCQPPTNLCENNKNNRYRFFCRKRGTLDLIKTQCEEQERQKPQKGNSN